LSRVVLLHTREQVPLHGIVEVLNKVRKRTPRIVVSTCEIVQFVVSGMLTTAEEREERFTERCKDVRFSK
jgi:hypothetical protein